MKSLRLAIIGLAAVVLSGCAGMQLGPNTTTGIGVGAVAGAVLNRDDPAAGAIIGGVLGGAVGSTIDNNNGQYSGPVYQGGHNHRNRCDWRCQEWREQQAREEYRREQLRRQLEWQNYCRYNWRYDRRCR